MRARMSLILTSSQCELREVLLKNKPDAMIGISPKGTVPILNLHGEILEESLEIIQWAIKKNSSKLHSFSEIESSISSHLINLFDTQFKYHLDRYKYSDRYENLSEDHQQECLRILFELDKCIDAKPWIFGKTVSLLDICILPFIRQCKIANPNWFESQGFSKVIDLLLHFESSELFLLSMEKFDVWDPENPQINIFPK
tara:strand:- start:379 stop:975 length:597 start_codon:yes stop_codon:yes gene_type:complete